MVEVLEADDEARTATLEMSRSDVFDFRAAIFSADYDGDGPTDSEVWESLRAIFPSPSDEQVTATFRLTAEQLADVSNGLLKASEIAEDEGRVHTARRLLRQAHTVVEALDAAGEVGSASWRSDLILSEGQRLSEVSA